MAATYPRPVPVPLIAPLAASGSHTIKLVRQARAGSSPDDPDVAAVESAYTFFSCRRWTRREPRASRRSG